MKQTVLITLFFLTTQLCTMDMAIKKTTTFKPSLQRTSSCIDLFAQKKPLMRTISSCNLFASWFDEKPPYPYQKELFSNNKSEVHYAIERIKALPVNPDTYLNVNALHKMRKGFTPIGHAVFYRNRETLQCLLDAHVDPNVACLINVRTRDASRTLTPISPLEFAAFYADDYFIEKLVPYAPLPLRKRALHVILTKYCAQNAASYFTPLQLLIQPNSPEAPELLSDIDKFVEYDPTFQQKDATLKRALTLSLSFMTSILCRTENTYDANRVARIQQ